MQVPVTHLLVAATEQLQTNLTAALACARTYRRACRPEGTETSALGSAITLYGARAQDLLANLKPMIANGRSANRLWRANLSARRAITTTLGAMASGSLLTSPPNTTDNFKDAGVDEATRLTKWLKSYSLVRPVGAFAAACRIISSESDLRAFVDDSPLGTVAVEQAVGSLRLAGDAVLETAKILELAQQALPA